MTSLEQTASGAAPPLATTRRSARPPASARLLLHLLTRLSRGELCVRTPAGALHTFGPGRDDAGRGDFVFSDWALARDVLRGGDVAFAEAYIAGRWTTPDLPALLTVLAHNEAAIDRAFHGKRWQQWLFRAHHWLNANTKRQAKRNIVAHYDLGNAFYGLWLDPTLTAISRRRCPSRKRRSTSASSPSSRFLPARTSSRSGVAGAALRRPPRARAIASPGYRCPTRRPRTRANALRTPAFPIA